MKKVLKILQLVAAIILALIPKSYLINKDRKDEVLKNDHNLCDTRFTTQKQSEKSVQVIWKEFILIKNWSSTVKRLWGSVFLCKNNEYIVRKYSISIKNKPLIVRNKGFAQNIFHFCNNL